MRTKQLCSALLREIRLMLIFWRMELGIMILSPVIFSLIPYIRELRGRSNLDPEVLAYAGLSATAVYLVYYVIYETTKCERESKSLEKATAFWGIKRIVLAKSIVAGCVGLLGEILFCVCYTAIHFETDIFSLEIFLLTALNTVIFAFLGTAILCITDSLAANTVLAMFPFLSLTVILLQTVWLNIFILVVESMVTVIVLHKLQGQIRRGHAGWLR